MPVVLLKQRDLFTKRWKNVAELDSSELALQIALVARLRRELRPDVIFNHVPNGGYRDQSTAAKLKAMGTLPGVSDLVFHWCERDRVHVGGHLRTLFLELKRKRGRSSPAQQAFAKRARAIGCGYEIATTVAEAMDILGKSGLVQPVHF